MNYSTSYSITSPVHEDVRKQLLFVIHFKILHDLIILQYTHSKWLLIFHWEQQSIQDRRYQLERGDDSIQPDFLSQLLQPDHAATTSADLAEKYIMNSVVIILALSKVFPAYEWLIFNVSLSVRSIFTVFSWFWNITDPLLLCIQFESGQEWTMGIKSHSISSQSILRRKKRILTRLIRLVILNDLCHLQQKNLLNFHRKPVLFQPDRVVPSAIREVCREHREWHREEQRLRRNTWRWKRCPYRLKPSTWWYR